MKTLKAVAPYAPQGSDHFKTQAFAAWKATGALTAPVHYPPRPLHRLFFAHSLPRLTEGREARLRFVEALSIGFDTFPDHALCEVVPMVWDCWPMYFDRTCDWLARHRVQTAIFTSSQTAERMRQHFPQMNILFTPEGIATALYAGGNPLAERAIDVFEIGSVNRSWYKRRFPDDYQRLCHLPPAADLSTNAGFRQVLQDARLTVVVPRCMTQPEDTGDIETLTQRYWEAMLSRMLMVGHAPRELTDLLGYNPVIELDTSHPTEQIENILSHIADYQPLVDRNREAALQHGDWRLRMLQVQEFLAANGYQVKEERRAAWNA